MAGLKSICFLAKALTRGAGCLAVVALAACGTAPVSAADATPAATAPGTPDTDGALASQPAVVDGQRYRIVQLTDSTWAAVPASAAAGEAVVASVSQRAELVRLIEQASGCKVTDIDFARRPAQLDTQVDCATRLKN